MSTDDSPPAGETPAPRPKIALPYEHSANLAELLGSAGVTLLISTYQAGKLFVAGTFDGQMAFSLHSFDRAMGLAVAPDRIAVGARQEIWVLRAAAGLGPNIEPPGKYDSCFLTRTAHVTGEIHGHELAWLGDELWVANTLFSCLCSVHDQFSFVARWRPPFITEIAAEDRCHLNGMAIHDGQVKYATAMAESNTAGGWRPEKATSGCIIDVASGAVVARGFAMPHSPRLYADRLWVLDSGKGLLCVVDPSSGRVEEVARFEGYTRGLTFAGPYAFVGLSRIRETSVFSGIPIAERRDELRCGVSIIDWRTGQKVALLQFHGGITEIFDVKVLPVRLPYVSGPDPAKDEAKTIWWVPRPGR
jgi:uncharacterized protein (TIGR03032 family)